MSGWYEKGVGEKSDKPTSQKPVYQAGLMPNDFRRDPKSYSDYVVDTKNFEGRTSGYYPGTTIPKVHVVLGLLLVNYVSIGYNSFLKAGYDDLPGNYLDSLATLRKQFKRSGQRMETAMNAIFSHYFGGVKWEKGWSLDKVSYTLVLTPVEADSFWFEVSKFAMAIDSVYGEVSSSSTIALDEYQNALKNAPENFAKGVGIILGEAAKVVGKAAGGAAAGIFEGLKASLGKPVLYGGIAVLSYITYKLVMAGRLNLQKSAAVQPKVVRYEYVGVDDKGIQKKLKKRMG